MPDDELTQAAHIAYNEFWNDYYDVVKAQDTIVSYFPYSGINTSFDLWLSDLVKRQKEILFDLRTVYGELYDDFNTKQQNAIGTFIRRATSDLKDVNMLSMSGGLGLAVIILAAGVVVSVLAAGALVNYHRNINLQKERLELQHEMLPLVAAGKLPADVLRPIETSGGMFSGLFGGLRNIIILGLGIAVLFPVVKNMLKGKG